MEKLNKRTAAMLAVIFFGSAAVLGSALFFVPFYKNISREMVQSHGQLESSRQLLLRKEALESEWNIKKSYLKEGVSADELLNTWIKDLLSYAQAQSLVMDKLEPAGVREGPQGKESLVFISFQGDIKKLTIFLYHLLESDPMVRVESFLIRQDEDSKGLSLECMLGKVLS